MTTEERKSFDDFKRELLENPTFGLNFFGNMDKVELDNVGDLITRNRLMSEAKNKFICQHGNPLSERGFRRIRERFGRGMGERPT